MRGARKSVTDPLTCANMADASAGEHPKAAATAAEVACGRLIMSSCRPSRITRAVSAGYRPA